MERNSPGHFAPGSESSREQKFHGSRRPWSERAKERKFQGANWAGSEKAVKPVNSLHIEVCAVNPS